MNYAILQPVSWVLLCGTPSSCFNAAVYNNWPPMTNPLSHDDGPGIIIKVARDNQINLAWGSN